MKEFSDKCANEYATMLFPSMIKAYNSVIAVTDGIINHPHKENVHEYKMMPLSKVKKLEAQAYKRIIKNICKVTAVQTPVICYTFDTAENRMAKYQLIEVLNKLIEFINTYEEKMIFGEEIAQYLESMAQELSIRLNAHLFRGVEARFYAMPFKDARYRFLYKYCIEFCAAINSKCADTNFTRDVLVGALRKATQLDSCLKGNFYHIPSIYLSENDFPIKYIAIYQSKTLFGSKAGIMYYGEVSGYTLISRAKISEIPKNIDQPYYKFTVKKWDTLPRPIIPKEIGCQTHFFTSSFLLQNAYETPQLLLETQNEYTFYVKLREMVLKRDTIIIGTKTIIIEDEHIRVICDGEEKCSVPLSVYAKSPLSSFITIYSGVYLI